MLNELSDRFKDGWAKICGFLVVINKADSSVNGVADTGYPLLKVYSRPISPYQFSIPIVEYWPWTTAPS